MFGHANLGDTIPPHHFSEGPLGNLPHVFGQIATHLPRINFGSLCLAVMLFLLPWTSVQCNGRPVATQSGLQAVYGGISPAGDLKDMAEQRGKDTNSEEPEKGIGIGVLVSAILLLSLTGAVMAGLQVFRNRTPEVTPGAIAATALALMLLAALIGLPIDREIADSMKQMRAPQPALGSNRAGPDPAIQGLLSAALNIQASRTGWYYLTWFALAVPSGLYLYGRMPSPVARDEPV